MLFVRNMAHCLVPGFNVITFLMAALEKFSEGKKSWPPYFSLPRNKWGMIIFYYVSIWNKNSEFKSINNYCLIYLIHNLKLEVDINEMIFVY